MIPAFKRHQSKINQLKQQYLQDYSINYRDLCKQSWALTQGAKAPILIATILSWLIYFSIESLLTSLGLLSASSPQLLQLLVDALLLQPLIAGLWLLGIQRVRGKPLKLITLFSCIRWRPIVHIFISALWQSALYALIGSITIGLLKFSNASLSLTQISLNLSTFMILGLASLAILYVSLIYFIALPLIASLHLASYDALSLARIAINKHLAKLLGLFALLALLIPLVSFLSLGIALIWLIPWSLILQACLFTRLFLSPRPTIESREPQD